jgi:DNA mismatch endonuclease (patch repair protein)
MNPVTSGWKAAPPPTSAWKASSGTSPSREQDIAAGGHERRVIELRDGRTALASISLRVYKKSRRIRAYLRWSDHGLTREAYLGEVDGETREENLRSAWRLAHMQGLTSEKHVSHRETRGRPRATSVDVRASMQGNRSRDTKPELALRSRLHALGLRYRVSTPPMPGVRRTADIVFTRARVAVFVDGCYWHGCADHHRPAKRNSEFWKTKIEANRRRDAEVNQMLSGAGWEVVRVWEHEDPCEAAHRIEAVVRSRHYEKGMTTEDS